MSESSAVVQITQFVLLLFFFSSSTDRTLFIAFQHRNIFSVYWRAVSFLYFFLGSTTEFLLLSLLFVSSEICIFFTLKPIIKHASLITPSLSHTTNTCTFRDFRVLQKTKSKKKKIKKKWKKFQVFLVLTLIWL